MKIEIRELPFLLPGDRFAGSLKKIGNLTQELHSVAGEAGTGSVEFRVAYDALLEGIQQGRDLETELDSLIKLRALAQILLTRDADSVSLTQRVFDKVKRLCSIPSTSLVQGVYQFYLMRFDKTGERWAVEYWLLENLLRRNLKKNWHEHLLKKSGPKWLAQESLKNKRELRNQIAHLGLDRYDADGRFFTVAKSIHIVEQLEHIPLNQPHALLQDVQKQSVYDTPYDEKLLLGHKVLEILITRAANTLVDESWIEVVMAIGGDPRVPRSHPNHQKWWSKLDKNLLVIVQVWLSRLDLRLYLEALKNFSDCYDKNDLRRMFPSRKQFLEGLEKKGLISHTRLYLSKGAELYLRQSYGEAYLPHYSSIHNGERSLIYVQLAKGQAHLIEGSHKCYLWIYKKLHESAIVFDYDRQSVSYDDLTSDMDHKMSGIGCTPLDKIQHNPVNFTWQRRAVEILREIGVNVLAADVLSADDYRIYQCKYGVF